MVVVLDLPFMPRNTILVWNIDGHASLEPLRYSET
jgi:hypothetical protein